MPYKSYEVYDNDDFFDQYIHKRNRGNAPNELIEKPIIEALLGNVQGKEILDLGCGDGIFGKELLDKGAKYYYGIDGSVNMTKLANKNLNGCNATIAKQAIESFQFKEKIFDLILSRLVFHYIEHIDELLAKIESCLRKNGEFICSMEHPIITSCYESYHNNSKRMNWVVDNYFYSGERINTWIDKDVVKYHKTIEEYFKAFKSANFEVSEIRESKPLLVNFKEKSEFERRMKIPLFIIFKLLKK